MIPLPYISVAVIQVCLSFSYLLSCQANKHERLLVQIHQCFIFICFATDKFTIKVDRFTFLLLNDIATGWLLAAGVYVLHYQPSTWLCPNIITFNIDIFLKQMIALHCEYVLKMFVKNVNLNIMCYITKNYINVVTKSFTIYFFAINIPMKNFHDRCEILYIKKKYIKSILNLSTAKCH